MLDGRFARLLSLARAGEAPSATLPADRLAEIQRLVEVTASRVVVARGRRRSLIRATLAAAAAAAAIATVVIGVALAERREDSSSMPVVAWATGSAPSELAPPKTAPHDAAGASRMETLARESVESHDWRVRWRAVDALSGLASEANPAVDQALARAVMRDPNWRVRARALDAFARARGDSSTLALAAALEDRNIRIRFAALSAISERAEVSPLAIEALLGRLAHDPDWRVRESALNILLRTDAGQRAADLAAWDGHRRLRDAAQLALLGPAYALD